MSKPSPERMHEALLRIAHATVDGLDTARDSVVLERTVREARKALGAVKPNPYKEFKYVRS